MPQWYTSSEGAERLIMERELVAIDFPQFQLFIHDDGSVTYSGTIGPSVDLQRSYQILAEYPYFYPGSNPIKVYLPYEKFPSSTPHLYPGGALCLEHGNFKRDDTIVTVLGWATQWLIAYEEFKRTGKKW